MSTFWGNVVEKDSEMAVPWETREVEGAGIAAFATRRFACGDLIIAERPMVWVHGHHPFDETQVAEIEERVAALDDESRTAFYDMANVFPEAATAATGIFMTNCFDMADSPHGESCAMYLALARLNHSCTPNVQQSHLPDTGQEVVYAARDIEEGEELNDCYIDLRQDTRCRRAALQEIYRFDCSCKACMVASPDDDRRRVRAAKFGESVFQALEDGPETATHVAEDAIRLLKMPDCLPWSARYLAEAYTTLYHLNVACGQSEHVARKDLLAAHKWNVRLSGEDSPESHSTADKLLLTLPSDGKKNTNKKH